MSLADAIAANFGVPSPGAVNDKLIAYFKNTKTGNGSPVGVVIGPGFYWDLTNFTLYTNANANNTSWAVFGSSSYVSVISGLVGDDATDNTAALIAAIAAAPDGSTLRFPNVAGVFRYGDLGDINKSIRIEGMGPPRKGYDGSNPAMGTRLHYVGAGTAGLIFRPPNADQNRISVQLANLQVIGGGILLDGRGFASTAIYPAFENVSCVQGTGDGFLIQGMVYEGRFIGLWAYGFAAGDGIKVVAGAGQPGELWWDDLHSDYNLNGMTLAGGGDHTIGRASLSRNTVAAFAANAVRAKVRSIIAESNSGAGPVVGFTDCLNAELDALVVNYGAAYAGTGLAVLGTTDSLLVGTTVFNNATTGKDITTAAGTKNTRVANYRGSGAGYTLGGADDAIWTGAVQVGGKTRFKASDANNTPVIIEGDAAQNADIFDYKVGVNTRARIVADGGMRSNSEVSARLAAATQTQIGAVGPASQAGVQMGLTNPVNLYKVGTGVMGADSDISCETAGKGLKVKEGTNAKMGVATLVGGTVVVSTTAVTASSRIMLTVQSLGTVAVASALAVTARVAGTSFTITASVATDTSIVAWMIVEPA